MSHWCLSHLGDNHIQNFHLGRYIVGYTGGNLVLQGRESGDIKGDFRPYIQRYTSPNENFEYVYPNSNAFLQFLSQIGVLQATKSRTISNDMRRN